MHLLEVHKTLLTLIEQFCEIRSYLGVDYRLIRAYKISKVTKRYYKS